MTATSDISSCDHYPVGSDYPLCWWRPKQIVAGVLFSHSELAELMERMWTGKRNDGSLGHEPQVSAAAAKGRRCQSL